MIIRYELSFISTQISYVNQGYANLINKRISLLELKVPTLTTSI